MIHYDYVSFDVTWYGYMIWNHQSAFISTKILIAKRFNSIIEIVHTLHMHVWWLAIYQIITNIGTNETSFVTSAFLSIWVSTDDAQ